MSMKSLKELMGEMLELRKDSDFQRDLYLELRDAKSDGCCHRMSVSEVLAYDRTIMQAHERYQKAEQAWRTAAMRKMEVERSATKNVANNLMVLMGSDDYNLVYNFIRTELDESCGGHPSYRALAELLRILEVAD